MLKKIKVLILVTLVFLTIQVSAAVTDIVDFGNGASQTVDEAAHNLQLDGWSGGGIDADSRWANTGSLYWLMATDGSGGSYELTLSTLNNLTQATWGNWKFEYQHSAKNNLFNNGDPTVTEIFSSAGDPPLSIDAPNDLMTITMDLPFDTAGIGVRYRAFALIMGFDASLARTAASPYADVVDLGKGVYQSASETAHSVTTNMAVWSEDSRSGSAAGALVEWDLTVPSAGKYNVPVHLRDTLTEFENGFGVSQFWLRFNRYGTEILEPYTPVSTDTVANINNYEVMLPAAGSYTFRLNRATGLVVGFGAAIEQIGAYAPLRIDGQQWVRNNPLTMAGYFSMVPGNTHGVDTAGEIQDFIDNGLNTLHYHGDDDNPPTNWDNVTRDLAKSVDPNMALLIWRHNDNDLDAAYATYGGSNPVIMQSGDELGRPDWPLHAFIIARSKVYYPEWMTTTSILPRTPNYGAGSDPTYMEDIVTDLDPDIILSFIYPFAIDGSTSWHRMLDYMTEVRRLGLLKNKPYMTWLTGATTQNPPPAAGAIDNRVPSETDLRMFMFSSLTFGFTGFDYFAYAHRDQPGLVDLSGNPLPLYYTAQTVHPEISNVGEVTKNAVSSGMFYLPGQVGAVPNPLPTAFGIGALTLPIWAAGLDPDPNILDISIGEDDLLKNGLVGFFTADDGQEYFMLTNLYSGPSITPASGSVTFSVDFDSVTSLLHINRLTGVQEVVPVTANTLTVVLPGGTGELYKYNNGVDFINAVPGNCAQAIAATGGNIGDLDSDCYVNLIDMAVFSNDWRSNGTIGDLDNDGYVDAKDLDILLNEWLYCFDPTDPQCDRPWE